MKKTIIIAAVVLGAAFGSASWVNASINADVAQNKASHLVMEQPQGNELPVYQLQGGPRRLEQAAGQSTQILQPTRQDQPADPESGDNTQPAMGYNALGWTFVQ